MTRTWHEFERFDAWDFEAQWVTAECRTPSEADGWRDQYLRRYELGALADLWQRGVWTR